MYSKILAAVPFVFVLLVAAFIACGNDSSSNSSETPESSSGTVTTSSENNAVIESSSGTSIASSDTETARDTVWNKAYLTWYTSWPEPGSEECEDYNGCTWAGWFAGLEDQQTEQPVEEDYWAMAAEFADSLGADIITSSLGYAEYDNLPGYYHQYDLDGHTSYISHTASMLANKGIILVNSAGNSGMGPWKKITFPADAENTLTVGALNQQRINAPFSGVGPTQDMRIKPDVMALGSPASLISGRGGVIRDMGTSFSTPIVAGLVACLWQALPNKTALQIMDLVRQNGSNHEKPDNIYGYGAPNFWRAYMIGKANLEVRTEN